jgi:hypothetical protein
MRSVGARMCDADVDQTLVRFAAMSYSNVSKFSIVLKFCTTAETYIYIYFFRVLADIDELFTVMNFVPYAW